MKHYPKNYPTWNTNTWGIHKLSSRHKHTRQNIAHRINNNKNVCAPITQPPHSPSRNSSWESKQSSPPNPMKKMKRKKIVKYNFDISMSLISKLDLFLPYKNLLWLFCLIIMNLLLFFDWVQHSTATVGCGTNYSLLNFFRTCNSTFLKTTMS